MSVFSKKIIVINLFLIIAIFFSIGSVLAAGVIDPALRPAPTDSKGIGNWKAILSEGQSDQYYQTGDLTDPTAKLISYIRGITYFVSFVATTFLIRIVWAGYLWMTAEGDSEKIEGAKKTITHAVIGVILIIGLYALTYFIVFKTAFITGFTG